MIHGPAPGPPHHLILTREAAGCESRPEPDGLRSLAFATVGTALLPPRRPECRVPPPAAERAGSNAPLCEVGWPRTSHTKTRGLRGGRPPGESDAGLTLAQGILPLACSAGWVRGPSGASEWRGAWWPCTVWGGRGCRAGAAAPIEGLGRRGPWRGGNPGYCLAHCCILGPANPDPETQAAATTLTTARCPPCLPRRQDGVSVPTPAPAWQTKAGSHRFERWW